MLRRVAAVTLGVALLAPTAGSAQYFGRNKVRYDDFEFRVLQTPHFDIYYYSQESDAVGLAARLAERWYDRLSRALDHEFEERQPIVLYASHSHFAQTTVVPGFIGEGVGGVTEHLRGRVVMPFGASLGVTEHVLGHELVHAFQRDILRQAGRSIGALPLWFVEGMAEHLASGRLDANTAMWLRDAVADDRLPTIEQLDDPRWFPYRYGQALWAYLAARFGGQVVMEALKSRVPGNAIRRLAAATGAGPRALTEGWHEWIRSTVEDAERRPQPDPRPLLAAGEQEGRLQIAPALSPDGKRIVFLSERDRYSVDLYLADAATGAIERRLVRTAASAGIESLQFMGSAGSWDRDGQTFVLAAMRDGQPVVTMLDTTSGAATREIALPVLDEVFNPSRSPDGRRLLFSAMKGGVSDLYLWDLEADRLRALTADAFADLQPAWSPDGRTIAFATDRFSSSLETVTFGSIRLGLIDVATGAIRELRGVPGGRHIDPKWSADGGSIYFVAEADGRSNVHRVDVRTGRVFRVTDVSTGVSGVTAFSPALSVAAAADRLAFTTYRHGAYRLHVVDTGAGRPIEAPVAAGPAAVRGPMPAASEAENEAPFPSRPYRPTLSLNQIGQPYLSAGGGSFGTFFRAGVSFSFADMLGEQALTTALQVGGSASDFAVHAAYLNRQSRWNWAVAAEQVPALLGVSRTEVARSAGGQGAVTTTRAVSRQLHREVSAAAIYPFSRARRFELRGGAHHIAFDRQLTTSTYSTAGELLHESEDHGAAPPAVALVETAAALVQDSALLGPTSPILGTRYRFELAPTFGGLSFVSATADYRRYLMPRRPFTVALRVRHVGRYGPDAGDRRLLPLLYSVRDAVRGYDMEALAAQRCGPGAAAECALQQYLGTRGLMAGNVELRFPIPGALRGTSSYGPVPMEGFVFSDAARVWSLDDTGGRLDLARSLHTVGAGLRLGPGGFVFELAAARALHAPQRGWSFVTRFRPGF